MKEMYNNYKKEITKKNNLVILVLIVFIIGIIFGSIYITTTDDTVEKVQARYGGTWEKFAAGRTIVGRYSSDSDFDTVLETGGSKTHRHSHGDLRAKIEGEALKNADKGGFILSLK